MVTLFTIKLVITITLIRPGSVEIRAKFITLFDKIFQINREYVASNPDVNVEDGLYFKNGKFFVPERSEKKSEKYLKTELIKIIYGAKIPTYLNKSKIIRLIDVRYY